MALSICRRSAGSLLSALRHLPVIAPRQLKTDDLFSSLPFSVLQSTARRNIFQSWAVCTQSGSEDGVKIPHPESNLPVISQNQQETNVIPRVERDPEGVDLSKLEKRPNVGTFLLKLDFEKDISKILFFLKDVGVEDNQLGAFLTTNPFILSEDLDNLHKRVAYLSSKKFSRHAIARLVSRAPYLLNFSVERLDNRLGFFQKELGLSGEKTRELVTRLPRMITGSLEPIRENLKVFEIEFGFRKNEIQQIALKVPKMLAGNKRKLTETFDYVHNTMGIPHHMITHFPQVFNTRLLKLKERHEFLTFLGRGIYDPKEPNYVSLDKLVSMPDQTFCEEIAKASTRDFEQFQKQL
ncbi:transcription termination factor 3, mitochondrial isoform X2 [Ranitomeya imitator]|uniref:transcription termination factor 3, mitochondrial isoform X2 n=1 Tax=Ranitomeya imitator TaxID=111125 RepID=UPI0037E99EBC